MIKHVSFVLTGMVIFAACHSRGQHYQALQRKVDSLQKRLDDAYRPGLGEFMSDIQVHHAKLWFAGNAGNWPLADFEVGEIREALENVNKYCADRPEVASLPMIRPAIDSVGSAIAAANIPAFKRSFGMLTATCNNCHQATKHGFNVIKVPDVPPITNQVFSK